MTTAKFSFDQAPLSHLLQTPCLARAGSFLQNKLRKSSLNGLTVTMALAAFSVTPAHAQLGSPDFSASQQVTISGDYLPLNSFNTVPFSDSYSGNSFGSSDFDFSSLNGIQTGSASWNNSLDAQGFVRANSELNINHQFGAAEGDFTKLKVDVLNTVSYFDLLQVRDIAPPGSPNRAPFEDPYIIRFQTRLTGSLSNTVTYDDPSNDGASKAEYSSFVEFSGRFASTNGDADTPIDIGDTYSNLDTPGRFGANVNESDTVLVDVFFEDQLFDLRDGVFFSFDYSDDFSVDIEFIDAGSIDIQMSNDLGSTIITTASIFDLDGNLMPNLVAFSPEFGYDLAPNPVPIPAAAWLFGSALLGLGLSRRRKTLSINTFATSRHLRKNKP